MKTTRDYTPRCTACKERETFHISGICADCRPACRDCGRRNTNKFGPYCSVCFKARQRGWASAGPKQSEASK